MITQPSIIRRLPSKDVSHLLGEGANLETKRRAWEKVAGTFPDQEEPYSWYNVPAASTMHTCDLHYSSEVYAFALVLAHDLDGLKEEYFL